MVQIPENTKLPLIAALAAVLALAGPTCVFNRAGLSEGPFCGNGVREGGEICDGEDTGGATCETIGGYSSGVLRCNSSCTQYDPSDCVIPHCGDGIQNDPEECDSDDLGGMTCQTLGEGFTGGTLACGALCRFNVSGCVNLPDCGDGGLDPGETCDGLDLAGTTCEQLGLGSGVLRCRADCSDFDTSGCGGSAVCSNGVREGNEVCDGADLNNETCAGLGFPGGSLTCAADCTAFDTSTCIQHDGGPCETAADCESGECWSESSSGFPDGFCTRDCTTSCPGNGYCLDIDIMYSRCVRPCTGNADCREGYICMDPIDEGQLFCWPLCQNAADCPDTGTCNTWTGLCNDPVTGSDNGESCANDDQCKGYCNFYWPAGYCQSLCSLSTPACPGDGMCSDIIDSWDNGDVGFCLDGCSVDGDCTRGGYDCYDNQDGPGRVCRPWP